MHYYCYKFRLENPTAQISRSTFFKMKPNKIMSIVWAARRPCLCIQHANMASLSSIKNLQKSSTTVLQMIAGDVTSALAKVPYGPVKFMR